jgi:glycosyltransferase involved in cell wall biosynthesis
VAVVVEYFDPGIVGGAEVSLRRMAEVLRAAGHDVEVFTTGTAVEGNDDIPVHRFPLDPRDPELFAAAWQRLEQTVHPEQSVRELQEHALHSAGLIAALRERIGQFDAVLTGPYLSGLAQDVARAFPAKALLVPCFHDEPAARRDEFLAACRGVAGILYHSPEEQEWAEAELGVNVPGAACVGTYLEAAPGDGQRGRQLVGTGRSYLLYCGRYTPHKNLPRLLDCARRYAERHPDRFTFAFTGQGEWPIPAETWSRNLGWVSDDRLRDLMAGAAALVQLSRRESLSLVALEGWEQGVPVLADASCAVLAGHIRRGQGGQAVASFAEFAAALDELWEQPQQWEERGRLGQEYVRRHYGCRQTFLVRLEQAVRSLALPLAERMRRFGRQRAEEHSRPRWRERFAHLVEEWLHAPARPYRQEVEIQARDDGRSVTVGTEAVLLHVRVCNRGTHAVVPDGPARVFVRAQIQSSTDTGCEGTIAAPLPGLLVPGQTLPVAVRLPVPQQPGEYVVLLRAESTETILGTETRVHLVVEERECAHRSPSFAVLGQEVQEALAAAEHLKSLPDDYLDVTEGWFAPWKRWLKRKLLNNFKRAYVDVVVRQQSAFNQQVLTALHELAASCATLQQAIEAPRSHTESRFNQTNMDASLPQEEVHS